MKNSKRKRDATVPPAGTPTGESAAPSESQSEATDTSDGRASVTMIPTANASVAMQAAPVEQAHMHVLSANCTVRDCISLKSSLLDLLTDPRPVTIDVRAIERIDTAALQVLCAFVRDRDASGGKVLWLGINESFNEAVRLLGLQAALRMPDDLIAGAAA